MKTLELKLNPATGVYEADVSELAAKQSDNDAPGGDLSRNGASGLVGGIADFDFQGIPIGQAIVGAAGAGIGDIIARFAEPLIPAFGVLTPAMRRAIILGAAAWVVQTGPVKGVLGSQGSQAAALLLAVDATVTFFNARRLVGGLLGGFAGRTLGAGQTTQEQATVTGDTTPARASLFGL